MAVEPHYTNVATSAEAVQVDAGLRSYMLRVYNYMASAVALTGLVALLVANSATMVNLIFGNTIVFWVVLLAPLGVAFYFGARIQSMSTTTAQALFWAFAVLMGLSLSSVFLAYTGASIARTFFVTAASFAGLSLYGYTTKRDLSPIGSFLIMGLIGLIIASIVNIFLASNALNWIISVVGVLIFAGLTAYDTQKIKENYYDADDSATMTKKAISGALSLYLDFINLFLFLLRFMGQNR